MQVRNQQLELDMDQQTGSKSGKEFVKAPSCHAGLDEAQAQITIKLKIFHLNLSQDGKASACNAGDRGSIPGSGRPSGEGNGNPLHCSCLENPMDRGTW